MSTDSCQETKALGVANLKKPNSAHPVSLHSLHLWRTPETVAPRALFFLTIGKGDQRLWE